MKTLLIGDLIAQFQIFNQAAADTSKIAEKKQLASMALEYFDRATKLTESENINTIMTYFEFCLLVDNKPMFTDYVEFCLRNSFTPLSEDDLLRAMAAQPKF